MTENQTVDNQNQNGAGGSPSQPVSSGVGGSINDTDALSRLLDAKLNEALKPVLGELRGVQGRQDKDRTAFREFLDEYEKQKAKGLSNADAEQAANASISEREKTAKQEALLQQIAEKVLGPSSAGNGTSAAVSIVQEYNLDANDPDVIKNVLSQTDPKDAKIAALEHINRRVAAQPPSPTAAGSLQTKPPAPVGQAELLTGYTSEMMKARGKPGLLRQIREDYAKRGLPVDQVVLPA